MLKRLLVILALAAALAACGPSGGASGAPTTEPSVDALPSESMGTESASPSAS
jgi:hypothetical protein